MKTKNQLKEEVRLTQDLTSVVEVMKQIAATRLHHLEKLQVRFDAFATALQEFFYWMDTKEMKHPFFQNSVAARVTVLITSDAGFLGGLNAQVIQEGLAGFQKQRGDGLAPIGVRGRNGLLDLGHAPVGEFPGISDLIERDEIRAVKKWIVDKIMEGKYGGASVVYPHYYSITRQGVQRIELFPCKALPKQGQEPRRISREEQFLMESPVEDIIAYLTELWTSERLYALFWHSKLSELAARTLHLEESHQELGKERRRLHHLYSRLMHEETDRNIREIVSARSQMVKKEEEC